MSSEMNLKKLRAAGGKSQREIAEALGCTVSAYSKYENGEREPSLSSLFTLADYYGITLDELTGHAAVSPDAAAPGQEREKAGPDSVEVAKLKHAFDFSAAEKLKNPIVMGQLRSLEQYQDCLTVQDVYRRIEFLITVTGCDKKALTRAFGVSRSGFYHWEEYGDVVRRRNARIADLIMQYEIPAADSAGYRAVTEYLHSLPDDPELKTISLQRVKRIMDEFEIIAEDLRSQKAAVLQKVIGKYPPSHLPVAANALARNFDYHTPPCKVWCIDITEIQTGEGKLYLCAVIDLCGRYLIGYAFSSRMDVRLVKHALEAARTEAGKYHKLNDEPLLLHSDRGTQFRTPEMEDYLQAKGMKASMSKPKAPNDNACMESFFASLKCEYLYRYNIATFDTARRLAERYILYYNTIRIHETCRDTPFSCWSGTEAYRAKDTEK